MNKNMLEYTYKILVLEIIYIINKRICVNLYNPVINVNKYFRRGDIMEHMVINSMKGMILYNNKVLILKRALETNFGGGNWEFPGGKLEFGEELTEGLKREIQEETGLTVEVKKILFATSFRIHEHKQVIIMNYLCKSNTSKVKLSHEHTDYMWADKKELLVYLDKRILKDINENHILKQINIA